MDISASRRLGLGHQAAAAQSSHTGALKCASSHFGDSFGKLALVHGNPFANQFDGFCLIWFICQVISDDPSVSLGVERRHPDIPSCWHSDAADRPSCPSRCFGVHCPKLPCCLTRINKAAQTLKLLFERCRRPKSGDPCARAVRGRLGLCQPHGKTPSYPERDHIYREKDDQAGI